MSSLFINRIALGIGINSVFSLFSLIAVCLFWAEQFYTKPFLISPAKKKNKLLSCKLVWDTQELLCQMNVPSKFFPERLSSWNNNVKVQTSLPKYKEWDTYIYVSHYLFRKCNMNTCKITSSRKRQKEKKHKWFNTLFFWFQFWQVILESMFSLNKGAHC